MTEQLKYKDITEKIIGACFEASNSVIQTNCDSENPRSDNKDAIAT